MRVADDLDNLNLPKIPDAARYGILLGLAVQHTDDLDDGAPRTVRREHNPMESLPLRFRFGRGRWSGGDTFWTNAVQRRPHTGPNSGLYAGVRESLASRRGSRDNVRVMGQKNSKSMWALALYGQFFSWKYSF